MDDIVFLVTVLGSAGVGFVLSSTVGVGGGVLLLPVLAMRMSAYEAAAIVTMPMLLNNSMKLLVFRDFIDWRNGALSVAAAAHLAFLGAFGAGFVDDRVLKLGVAALTLVSIVSSRSRERESTSESDVQPLSSRFHLALTSACIGMASGLLGSAGPATPVGLRRLGLAQEKFVATVALLGLSLQLARLPAYAQQKAIPAGRLPLILAIAAVSVVSIFVGRTVVARLSIRRFRLFADLTTVAAALWLAWGAVAAGTAPR